MLETLIEIDGVKVGATKNSGLLRVEVDGRETLANTVAYWQAICVQIRAGDVRSLLLVDTLHGGTPLSEQDWLELVVRMEGTGLERVRIAHVKPLGLNQVEFCEIYARDAGIDARVFLHADDAMAWLKETSPAVA